MRCPGLASAFTPGIISAFTSPCCPSPPSRLGLELVVSMEFGLFLGSRSAKPASARGQLRPTNEHGWCPALIRWIGVLAVSLGPHLRGPFRPHLPCGLPTTSHCFALRHGGRPAPTSSAAETLGGRDWCLAVARFDKKPKETIMQPAVELIRHHVRGRFEFAR